MTVESDHIDLSSDERIDFHDLERRYEQGWQFAPFDQDRGQPAAWWDTTIGGLCPRVWNLIVRTVTR